MERSKYLESLIQNVEESGRSHKDKKESREKHKKEKKDKKSRSPSSDSSAQKKKKARKESGARPDARYSTSQGGRHPEGMASEVHIPGLTFNHFPGDAPGRKNGILGSICPQF